MTTKYGIISNVHNADPRLFNLAVDILTKEGADKLVLNGDITGDSFQGIDEANYLALVLQMAGNSGLETYVQAGSHEEFLLFEHVLKAVSNKYGNLINVRKNPKFTNNDHDLVFVPGSDWHAGNATETGYNWQTGDVDTAIYKGEKGPLYVTNLEDLKKQVTDAEKTIIFSHVPRKFSNVVNCVDHAYFAERQDGSLMPGVMIENAIRKQIGDVSSELIYKVAKENGFTMKKENRGNEDLARIFDECGINKNITGHFHESVHRANNKDGEHINEGESVDELYWMASHLDSGKVGMLEVSDKNVAYYNINLNNYLK